MVVIVLEFEKARVVGDVGEWNFVGGIKVDDFQKQNSSE